MRLIIFLFFIGGAVSLCAQTAAELDLILETKEVSFAQASRFVLAAADAADEKMEAASVFDLAKERGWLPKRAVVDSPIRLGELCFLMMGAFNIKGSFLYTLFPGPHYAYREFDYFGLIPGRKDPGLRVSGERLLQILDMVSTQWGGN
jgi:hypothetical protein